jgi:hypothetical protein
VEHVQSSETRLGRRQSKLKGKTSLFFFSWNIEERNESLSLSIFTKTINCISILFSISSFYDFTRLSTSENQTQNNDFYVKSIELIEPAMKSNVLKYLINSQSNKDVKQSQHPPWTQQR